MISSVIMPTPPVEPTPVLEPTETYAGGRPMIARPRLSPAQRAFDHVGLRRDGDRYPCKMPDYRRLLRPPAARSPTFQSTYLCPFRPSVPSASSALDEDPSCPPFELPPWPRIIHCSAKSSVRAGGRRGPNGPSGAVSTACLAVRPNPPSARADVVGRTALQARFQPLALLFGRIPPSARADVVAERPFRRGFNRLACLACRPTPIVE